jgi:hypothetical protein
MNVEDFQVLEKGKQIFQREKFVKKVNPLAKFFASGGEIMEWKTGFTRVIYYKTLCHFLRREIRLKQPAMCSGKNAIEQ